MSEVDSVVLTDGMIPAGVVKKPVIHGKVFFISSKIEQQDASECSVSEAQQPVDGVLFMKKNSSNCHVRSYINIINQLRIINIFLVSKHLLNLLISVRITVSRRKL